MRRYDDEKKNEIDEKREKKGKNMKIFLHKRVKMVFGIEFEILIRVSSHDTGNILEYEGAT